MGYQRKRKVLRLRFEDEPELEVLARSASIRKFLRIMQAADEMTAGSLTEEGITELFTFFAERVISWNVEDEDGKPVDCTVDYLLDEDFDWSVRLVLAWVQAVSGALRLPPLEMANQADPGIPGSIPVSPMPPDSSTGM